MAIRIDRPRFRAIFGRLAMAQDEAEEFVDALEDTFVESRDDLATKQDLALLRAELIAEIRALEARMTRMLLFVSLGLFTALAALMTLLQVFVN